MTSSRTSGNRESSTLRLDMPVKFLKGIGERRAEQLERLGIRTARDLLWHLPHRYVDASTVTPLARAEIGQEVACVGRVVAKGVLPTRRGLRIFHAVLRDDSGVLECVWPGQAFLDRTIAVGQTLLVSGPVRFYHGRQIAPREYVILAEADGEADPLAAGQGAAGLSRHRGPEPQGDPVADRPPSRCADRALRRSAPRGAPPRRRSYHGWPMRSAPSIVPPPPKRRSGAVAGSPSTSCSTSS